MTDDEWPPNRAEWGPGPWDSEPDQEWWMDGDYRCGVQRGPLGALCGYVGVPPQHPWWGKHYDALLFDYEVHGGLTFAGTKDIARAQAWFWFVGFDCSHAYDLIPGFRHTKTPGLHTYRDWAFVKGEIARLLHYAQLAMKQQEEAWASKSTCAPPRDD